MIPISVFTVTNLGKFTPLDQCQTCAKLKNNVVSNNYDKYSHKYNLQFENILFDLCRI